MTKAAFTFATLLRLTCPACGASDVRRAHRHSPVDWLLSPLTVRPYRCPSCNRRYYVLPILRAIAPARREKSRRTTGSHASRHTAARWPRLPSGTIRLAILGLVALLCAWAFLMFISQHPS